MSRSAFSAAAVSQVDCRPRTWLASEGVTPEIIPNPRASSRAIAAISMRWLNAAISGMASAIRASKAASDRRYSRRCAGQ